MASSMERWIDKVAVVTGASSGIGAAISKKLIDAGLKVVELDVKAKEDQKDNVNIKKGTLYFYQADLTKEEEVVKAFNWILEKLGPVHILINNAGTLGLTNLTEGDTEIWKRTIDVNILGLCTATREAIRQMRKYDINGHIVHLNSIGGHRVPYLPMLNVYTATKFAVTALTESLKFELNSLNTRIKVTSVSPGAVKTDIGVTSGFAAFPEFQKYKDVPMLEPEDVAYSILYVLSTPPHVQIPELTIQVMGETIH